MHQITAADQALLATAWRDAMVAMVTAKVAAQLYTGRPEAYCFARSCAEQALESYFCVVERVLG